jgi:thymidylate kinase
MIVIVEGIDRTGKTTLCKELEKKGFLYIKDNSKRAKTQEEEDAKLATYTSVICGLGVKRNVVVDRMHATEYVYGQVERGYISRGALDADEKLGDKKNVKLILMLPEDIEKSSLEHGKDLKAHNDMFVAFLIFSAIKNKMFGRFSEIPKIIARIMEEISV